MSMKDLFSIATTVSNSVNRAYISGNQVDGFEELDTRVYMVEKEIEMLKNDIAEGMLLSDFVAVSASGLSASEYLERQHKL